MCIQIESESGVRSQAIPDLPHAVTPRVEPELRPTLARLDAALVPCSSLKPIFDTVMNCHIMRGRTLLDEMGQLQAGQA